MKLKTLHLTNAWHAASGGISTFYRALIDAAERHGHPLRMVVPGEENRTEEGRHVRVHYVKAPHAPLSPAYRMIMPQSYLLPNGRIVSILREELPDVVEICDKYTLQYLGGLLREGWVHHLKWRPTVVGLSCERMDENFNAYLFRGLGGKAFVRAYMKWLYFPMFDHHITVSRHTAGELETASHGHKVRRGVWVEPMGVDFDRFSPARRNLAKRKLLAESASGGEESVLLLYAGRLAVEKNAGLLPALMQQLPGDYRLLIAGSGALRDELEAQAEACAPGRVCFLGHVDGRDALADLYANADVFVHPNPAEPFGIAPLEAMASGLPLVAPNSGGLTAYANSENAWLVNAGAREFVEAVVRIRTDPEERARKTAAARETAAHYRWESVTERFFQLYEELHALTQGARGEPEIAPAFYSTLGNYWGREVGAGT
jgi:glycosyltransferase involved in cell wall biosynthesis